MKVIDHSVRHIAQGTFDVFHVRRGYLGEFIYARKCQPKPSQTWLQIAPKTKNAVVEDYRLIAELDAMADPYMHSFGGDAPGPMVSFTVPGTSFTIKI